MIFFLQLVECYLLVDARYTIIPGTISITLSHVMKTGGIDVRLQVQALLGDYSHLS